MIIYISYLENNLNNYRFVDTSGRLFGCLTTVDPVTQHASISSIRGTFLDILLENQRRAPFGFLRIYGGKEAENREREDSDREKKVKGTVASAEPRKTTIVVNYSPYRRKENPSRIYISIDFGRKLLSEKEIGRPTPVAFRYFEPF